jgi:DNA-directed RNA polymerase subunit K/omega
LNEKYLAMAKESIDDTRVLINAAARRAAELSRGARPLIALTPGQEPDYLDVALLEIAEKKIDVVMHADKDA